MCLCVCVCVCVFAHECVCVFVRECVWVCVHLSIPVDLDNHVVGRSKWAPGASESDPHIGKPVGKEKAQAHREDGQGVHHKAFQPVDPVAYLRLQRQRDTIESGIVYKCQLDRYM